MELRVKKIPGKEFVSVWEAARRHPAADIQLREIGAAGARKGTGHFSFSKSLNLFRQRNDSSSPA
jgi:hypothetical protein